MKLRWIRRFLLFFGAFLVLAIGAAAILVLSGVLEFSIPDPITYKYYSWQRLTVFGCGLYLMLYGLYVMFYPGKYYYSRKEFIRQKTEGGDLLISVKAIENLVQQCVDLHEEIKVSNLKVVPTKKEGVLVRMKATMPSNISIPLAVAGLQKQIKQYVPASSGVPVKNVQVTVDKTSGSVPVSGIGETTAEEKAGRHDEKPVHQRLFERQPETSSEPAPAVPRQPAITQSESEPEESEPEEPLKEDESNE